MLDMKQMLENKIERCKKVAKNRGGRVIAELGKPFFREYLTNPRVTQVGDNIWITDENNNQMLNVNEWQEVFIYVRVGTGCSSQKIQV